MTLKTACPLTLSQAEKLIRNLPLSESELGFPLLRKLELKRRLDRMHPVILVEYDRIPYIYRDGNVRVTFDLNVCSAAEPDLFFAAEIPRRPVFPIGQHLMEVKYDGFLPDFIYRALNLGQLRQTPCSKYYLCRKYSFK